MSAHCEKCGIELGLELDCWACDLRAERDRYREALDLIIAEALHDTGEEDLADIARQALADQEKIDPGHPLACACPDCDDSRPPADQEPKR